MAIHVNGASMRAVSPPRVLVTGGSGFIGRRVVHALLDEGADVTVADRRAFPDEVSRDDGVGYLGGGRFRMVIGDLCDPSVVAEAVRPGTDIIIHLAALIGAYASCYGMAGCSLWFSNVYGPGMQEKDSFVPSLMRAARGVTGAGIPVVRVPPKPGEMPAVIVDISAARALGYAPAYDLKSGLSTVWPEFSEAAK
jgi:nucleoside-diphosphate-sugar epimerase